MEETDQTVIKVVDELTPEIRSEFLDEITEKESTAFDDSKMSAMDFSDFEMHIKITNSDTTMDVYSMRKVDDNVHQGKYKLIKKKND